MSCTLFDYLYRDAGNFKAFGCIALAGRISAGDREAIRAKLESGEYFIAEQVGVPPLYEQLYQWSNGRMASDHCWHELMGFREATAMPIGCAVDDKASEFVERFESVEEWNPSLSPHFQLAC